AEVLVAVLVAGVDRRGLDGELDGGVGGVGGIAADRGVEVVELATDSAHQMANLELGLGVVLVDDVRVGGKRRRGDEQQCGEDGEVFLHASLLLDLGSRDANCWFTWSRVRSSSSMNCASSFRPMPARA